MPHLKKILLVEDNPNDVELTIIALKECRLTNEIVVVRDGAEALDYLYRRGTYAQREPNVPAVVLLDLNLPGPYDGVEGCKRLRAEPATASTPVIFITAMADAESKQRAVDAGCTAYYTKPFSPTALLKEISSFKLRQKSIPDA